MDEKFFASSFKDPIMPDMVELTDKGITFRIRKLIGGTENFVFYSDISGVEIDNGLFFATIRVIPRARQEIVIKNFSKGDARKIKELILQNVPLHRPDAFR
jgi:Bacterial PH domain